MSEITKTFTFSSEPFSAQDVSRYLLDLGGIPRVVPQAVTVEANSVEEAVLAADEFDFPLVSMPHFLAEPINKEEAA